jgi:hypothetical protein
MLSARLNKTILSVISVTSLVSSLAMAQLTPGPSHGGGGSKPPTYNPCDVPTDPNCHGGGHGGGGLTPGPSHPSYPSEPSYPSYPSYPTYPSYPIEPSYPTYPEYNETFVTKRVSLNRSVYNQTISLNRLFNSDGRYNSYRVVSVSASTTPNSADTTKAKLVVNGYVEDKERNPGYDVFLKADRNTYFNSDIALEIEGSTYIQELRIELAY